MKVCFVNAVKGFCELHKPASRKTVVDKMKKKQEKRERIIINLQFCCSWRFSLLCSAIFICTYYRGCCHQLSFCLTSLELIVSWSYHNSLSFIYLQRADAKFYRVRKHERKFKSSSKRGIVWIICKLKVETFYGCIYKRTYLQKVYVYGQCIVCVHMIKHCAAAVFVALRFHRNVGDTVVVCWWDSSGS